MSRFRLVTAPDVDRTLERLPASAAAAVVAFITGELLEEPQRVGRPGRNELADCFVARRGVYRVVYRVIEESHEVRVLRVAHRADVYRPR